MMLSRTRPRIARLGVAVLLGAAFVAASAPALHAQVVTNPRIVEFDPSPDHSATLSSGQAAVTRYDLEVYSVGAVSPFHTVNMGKPAPQSDGKIRYDFSSQVSAWPLPGTTYEARVSAVGPNGTGRSDPSNQFTFGSTSPCAYALSTTSIEARKEGGSYQVNVTTASGCAWTASSQVAWMGVSTPNGTGTATVAFTVQANTTSSSRAGTLTIGGQTLTVTQPAADPTCTYTIAPTSTTVPAGGGTASFAVSAGSGCSWSATTTSGWISISGGSGSGNGTVSLSVGANTSTSPRTGTVSVNGKTFTLTQEAAPTTSCTYSLSPTSASIPAGGGTATFAVQTGAGCAWTASTTSPEWISIAGGSGTDKGSVTLTVAANATNVTRTGIVTVQGQVFTVTQDAAATQPEPCAYTLAPTGITLPADGGSGEVRVTTGPACAWTVVSSQGWLTPSVTSGTGSGTVAFVAKPNKGTRDRTATLTIGTEVFTVSLGSKDKPGKVKNLTIKVTK